MNCPKCNSENYKYVRKDWESGSGYNIDMQCLDCGYADFSKHYSHTVSYYGNFNAELFEAYQMKEREAWKVENEMKREKGLREWHDENDSYYNSQEWRTKRTYVLKRDGYLCQMCLNNQANDVHHLSYAHWMNELTCELISVCRRCHMIIHEKEPF